jgi:hypothetical protein
MTVRTGTRANPIRTDPFLRHGDSRLRAGQRDCSRLHRYGSEPFECALHWRLAVWLLV